MKRIIFAIILFVSVSFIEAQTISGYFVEQTKAVVPAFNQPGYHYGATVAVNAGGAAYYIVSPALGTSAANVRDAFMGKKVLLGINVTVAFAAVSATLVCEISGDNTNWVALSTLSSNTSPNITGVTWYLVDFTSTYAPFVRLKFNGGGLTINTAGYISFLYAVPN